jgi:endonuclease YncB( thermonuclease family)
VKAITRLAILAGLLLSTPAMAAPPDITGVPRILDGDTVEIDGTKIRLLGIDAPETHPLQFCLDPAGETWDCGVTARDELVEHVGASPWTCHVSGLDRYKRTLAACEVNGEDIQQWLVRSGWAMSFVRYSHKYDADEKAARDAGNGIWAGTFIAPWDWRHRNVDTVVLGATSVPVDAQAVLLRPQPRHSHRARRRP